MNNKVKKRDRKWNISQRSFEILSELVLNNKDTTDFILDWEEGFEGVNEKINDNMIHLQIFGRNMLVL